MRRMRFYVAGSLAAVALAATAWIVFAPGSDGNEVVACTGPAALDFDCYERRYVALTGSEGPAAALGGLAEQVEDSGYVRAACHQLGHRIGRAAGATSGVDAFADGDPVCGSGYYHGVIEAVMEEIGAGAAVARATSVCAELRTGDRYSPDHANCTHGMGHGFMDVLGRDVFRSLDGCDALAEQWERDNCYGGVFMENLFGVDRRESAFLRPQHPLYPCTAVADRYADPCYSVQTTYALLVNDTDFAHVFDLCSRVDGVHRASCYSGLGGDVTGETKAIAEAGARSQARRRLCLLGGDLRARANCIAGAVGVMIRDLDEGPTQADDFCASFEQARTQELHAACLRASEAGYSELLAQQLGRDPTNDPPPAPGDFVCHLKRT